MPPIFHVSLLPPLNPPLKDSTTSLQATLTAPARDPYHQLGLVVCSSLEAAMSMEVRPFHATLTDWMFMYPPQTVDTARAESSIAESLRLSSKYRQSAQLQKTTRFPAGLEWDVLIADATVLSGLIHVFRSAAAPLNHFSPLTHSSETYLGYARCM